MVAMSVHLFGRWSLKVTKAIHNWENRFVIDGATSGNGNYPPTVGLDVVAEGPAWTLTGQYRESDAHPWQPSAMVFDPGLERVDIRARIGSEDPLPVEDFEDIEWDARYLDGTMLEIPYRPYAVRTTDLFQMPDGIFETALGTYYMAVRVTNRWGRPFTNAHVLDISPASRAQLAMRGITVIDSWSQTELASLGQTQHGTGIVLGPLVPGSSRTVYFKVDVTAATPRKHEVEFVCRNTSGMADPNHPARRVKKSIFVSRTRVDTYTGEIVSEVLQGTLRLRLKEIAIDREGGRRARRPCAPGNRSGLRDPKTIERLRGALRALLEGRDIDPCLIRDILACYCACGPGGGGSHGEPGGPGDGRFCLDPFYAFPTKFSFTVTPRAPFDGQYGPIPFDDPWWKCLLLIIAIVLLLAGALAEAADVAYQDEDLVIGTLGRFQRDDVDAALCMLDTDRALAFLTTLDAQSDEDLQNAVTGLDGNITLNGPVMTRAEIDTILALPMDDPQRKVHKSGATTGVSHGLMTGLAPLGHDKSTWNIDQLTIQTDPDFNEPVSQGGDSGSIWVHTASLRPVALHHSGTDDDTLGRASLLEDVQNLLNITL